MNRRRLGFVGLTAVVAVPAAAAQIALGSTVARLISVPSESRVGVRITCPRGSLALSGGIRRPAREVTMLAVRPIGMRTYAFRLGNATGADARVTAAVACRRISDPAARTPFLSQTIVRSGLVRVPPRARRTVSVRCPAATLAGGSGFELDSARLSVRRRMQTLRRFSMTVRNPAATTGEIGLYGGCLTLVRPFRSVKRHLEVTVLTSTTRVRPGTHVLNQRCPRGWFSLATGYSLPAGLQVIGSAVIAGGGRWTLTNPASAQELPRLQLVCGRLAPS